MGSDEPSASMDSMTRARSATVDAIAGSKASRLRHTTSAAACVSELTE
jgi:hypothetical protein